MGESLIYRWLQGLVRIFLKIYHRIEIKGIERVPKEGPLIVVSNHESYLDPVYISAILPRRIYYMAKIELFQNRVLRWIIEYFGAFPVQRGEADLRAIRTALAHLKEGKAIGIFPEGRIQESYHTEIKQGAAYLAIRGDASVLPVFVTGTGRALKKGKKWIKPVKVRVIVGRPLRAEGTGVFRERQEQFSQQIAQALQDLSQLKPDNV